MGCEHLVHLVAIVVGRQGLPATLYRSGQCLVFFVSCCCMINRRSFLNPVQPQNFFFNDANSS